jgi:nucleotide-binding universal stress UspA family protein
MGGVGAGDRDASEGGLAMYGRLLVPLDGSRLAEVVLPMVARLAGACGSTIMLIHIIERAAHATVHGDRHLIAAAEANLYLEGLAANLRSQGLTVELHTHEAPEGDVARSIASHAVEIGTGLTVLCAHGHGGVRDLLFGTIAQQVLRVGTTPVLLVRPRADGTMPPFAPRVLLVPLDGSPEAEVAADQAAALARCLGADLRLLMVVPTQGTLAGERTAVTTLLPRAARAALELESESAGEYLAALAARLGQSGLTVSTEVARGAVPAVLGAAASAAGAGMVVLATHGRSAAQAVWTRNASAALLERPGLPVLLCRRA